MLAALKQRVVALAHGPYADAALFFLAFAESSFCPIPVDIALAPMAAAHPERWARFALITVIGSVFGAMAGYAIGYFAAETLGAWMFETFGMTARFQQFRAASIDVMPWVILIQGLTPISYKWVTIASGILRVSLPLLIACSIVTRTIRFFAVSYLFKRFGPAIGVVVERRLGLVTGVVAIILIVGAVAIYVLH